MWGVTEVPLEYGELSTFAGSDTRRQGMYPREVRVTLKLVADAPVITPFTGSDPNTGEDE